jgi:hypothetical protein
MLNIGPVALSEILQEFIDDLGEREATDLVSVERAVDELRDHIESRVRVESEAA